MEIARDVTENRALMRKLQASEKRFRAILDTATDAVISIDQDHGIILFNNAAQRIFGYSRQEVLGKKIHLLIPEKDRDPPGGGSQLLGRSLSGIVGKTLSLNGIRKGGEEFPIELSLSFLELDGEVTHTAIIRDVSDQKQLEKKLLQSERQPA
jgi:PAS domain S-box-containing protein